MGMIIEKGSKFFGLDAKLARDIIHDVHISACNNYLMLLSLGMLRYSIRKFIPLFKDEDYYHPLYQTLLEEAEKREQEIIDKIILEKWIVSVSDDGVSVEDSNYQLTKKAINLSRHKFIKRLPRQNALQKLTEFLLRVVDWNNTDPYVKVNNIWLYGSMLTSSQDVGDIDLVCQYIDNPSSPTYPSESEIMTDLMRGIDLLDRVKKHIINRSPYISIDGFNPNEVDMIDGGVLMLMSDGRLSKYAQKLISTIKIEKNKKNKPEKKWFYLGVERNPESTQFGMNIVDAKLVFSEMTRSDFYSFNFDFSINDIRYALENHIYRKNKKDGQRYWTDELTIKCNELLPSLVKNLIDDGFMIPSQPKNSSNIDYFKVTQKGIEFGLLKSAEPISKEKANKMLDKFLERVAAWNADNHHMTIKDVWAYGAIITDSECVGDIELICDFEYNPASPENLIDGFEVDNDENGNPFNPLASPFIKNQHSKKLKENSIKSLTMRLPRIIIKEHDPYFISFLQREGVYVQIVKDCEIIYTVPK